MRLRHNEVNIEATFDDHQSLLRMFIKYVFWVTFTCDLKIYLIIFEPPYTKLIFLLFGKNKSLL